MPNYTEEQQRIIDNLRQSRTIREETARSAVAARNIEVQTATEQRIIEREARRNRAVQTPRGSSEINYEFTANYPVAAAYAVSVNQSRPIYADFDSSFAYSMFLNSKYKHHHKCATCQRVFRCGKIKCERTLCKLCDLRTELSAETVPAPWTTGGGVRLNFNGSFGVSWTNIGTGHEVIVAYDEAAQHTAQNQVTVDYEAVERQLINEETATGRVDGDIEV